MKRTLLAVALLGCIATAEAVPVRLNWLNPTQFVDGSPLVASDIASTTVEFGTCVGINFGAKTGETVVTGSASTTTVDRPPGLWCYRASTTVIASKGGGTSVFSNVASHAIPFPNPRPPTILEAIIAFFKRIFNRNAA